MFEKSGKFYADWRDRSGRRLRKAFTSERAALKHEAEQKALARPRGLAMGRLSQPYSSPERAARTAVDRSTKRPSSSSPKLVRNARASSTAQTPSKSMTRSTATVVPIARATRSTGVRALLRWLWTHHGAPKLDEEIRTYPGVRPRNVTATDAERAAIFELASPHMRLFILLCSDLAIRAGTAGVLAPHHYDPARHLLRFTTKKAEKLTLPVTAEVRELLEQCDLSSNVPFVRQLWRKEQTTGKKPYPRANVRSSTLSAKFRRLKDEAGIERKLTPHDLRRTTAVAMLRHSGDVRDVQALLGHRSLNSTIWYLDHDLRPVSRDALEIIKRPFLVKKEHSA